MSKWKVTFYVERDDEEIELEAAGTYMSDPGYTRGPPEKCYPPSEDFEYELTLAGKPWDGELTVPEAAKLQEQAVESIEDDFDPPDEYDRDNDYDDPRDR